MLQMNNKEANVMEEHNVENQTMRSETNKKLEFYSGNYSEPLGRSEQRTTQGFWTDIFGSVFRPLPFSLTRAGTKQGQVTNWCMNSERECDSLDGEDMLRSVYLWDSSESRDKVWEMAGGKAGWVGPGRDWWLPVWAIGTMGLPIPTIWDAARSSLW